MEQITPMGAMMLLPSTKQQIQQFADSIISEVTEGNSNPLTVHIQITAMEKALEAIKEGIKSHALREAEKHNQKSFEFLGCMVEVKEMGTKWDFSGSNDPVYHRINQEKEDAVTALKQREAYLKVIHETKDEIDPETGEIFQLHPPAKRSTTGIAITLK